ncbi:hypothetical protein [uncultured Bacteroides sp.]|uniref:hypothetical protein n=1 Tax=uncultured Bacteroides sp. TaxID=162156 RepID=UPI002AAC3BB9|nr:hypothetical protein [uncultured Bacteroides sp.]
MEEIFFFILKLESRRKAKRIEHIIKTQLGVNSVNIDFKNRLMKINFDPNKISVEYMALLIHSMGADMVLSEHEASFWKNQLGNYFILKKRRKILYLLSSIAMIALIMHSSYWLLLGFSIFIFIFYLSLFIYQSNKHFFRSFWKIDKIGIISWFLFTALGVAGLYYHRAYDLVSILFFISILIVESITIYRWFNEKKSAEFDLL